MSDAKDKWLRQEQAVRATQMAFDLSSEVQKSIKKQAIDQELTPSDMIRKILGLDVKSKKTRQRLSFNLNDDEIAQLASRFEVAVDDKRAVKQQVADLLIEHTKKTK
ncbi:conserved hypothetical protein [Pseudoalteromonas sp. 3J6]|uniref:Ribbon-helix-helix protein CopG domain-containing protein n=1 Tax=Pseudoalteromonas undina TaxID=43660 RepID=A0ABN0NK42_9GAMM|nr:MULTISPECIES: hypothetical protein [Pseudoalteromonas]MBL0689559.1 hypothetical protein [Pseudoalteromonas sp.]NWL14925.1 hypothetical protein [Pseudoalteromonas sp. Scap03]KAF7771318.1 hypothetical protein PUND_a0046 [Pseudoalteromonas undina]KPH89361.1 hypothetical protein AMS57_17740 [Pseudoalteromonas undina]KPZ63230.1 hypothetical protein AN392_03564 [Pseudoalteromonas sp. P1-16-1b]